MGLVVAIAITIDFAGTEQGPPVTTQVLDWLNSLTSREAHYRADSTPPLVDMRKSENLLWQLCQRMKQQADKGKLNEGVRELVERITSRGEEIEKTKDATAQDKQQARMILVRAQFIGAKTWPAQYKEPFLASVSSIIQRSPGTEDAARADTLRFLYLHPLAKPPGSPFFKDLDAFTHAYANSPMVILIYRSVCTELVQNDHKRSAKAVLQYGLKRFQDTPQMLHLVSLGVGLGLRLRRRAR